MVDEPTQLWHSAQWAASIRTTSGEFAQYADGSGPIFPGDFCKFACSFTACPNCKAAPSSSVRVKGKSAQSKGHTGHILAVYRDERESTRELGDVEGNNKNEPCSDGKKGELVVVMARVWTAEPLLKMKPNGKNAPKKEDLRNAENIMVIHPTEYVVASNVLSQATIGIDNGFGSHVTFPDDKHRQPQTGRPAVRRVYHGGKNLYLPIVKIAPVAGVLEVEEFGRKYLVDNFAKRKVLSVPLLNFNDGFGLYRSMHKSLMGVYLQLACMQEEHRRQNNVLPVTLGPHGSNFAEVMEALGPMRALDKGVHSTINGKEVTLCGPILAQIGDMPQQQENSGCLSVSANLGCRVCEVPAEKRGDFKFDTDAFGRAHFEMQRLRRKMDEVSA